MWPGKKLLCWWKGKCKKRLIWEKRGGGREGVVGRERRGERGDGPAYGQDDVDEEVGAAAGDHEDADGRDCGEGRWVSDQLLVLR